MGRQEDGGPDRETLRHTAGVRHFGSLTYYVGGLLFAAAGELAELVGGGGRTGRGEFETGAGAGAGGERSGRGVAGRLF